MNTSEAILFPQPNSFQRKVMLTTPVMPEVAAIIVEAFLGDMATCPILLCGWQCQYNCLRHKTMRHSAPTECLVLPGLKEMKGKL